MVAVSIAAQIGVAPLIAYYFGRFSCYFLLTNFIVIPAATLILYLSLATLLIPSIGAILASIVGLLNTTLLYLATLPGATVEDLHPSIMLTASIYGIIFATYYLLWLIIPKSDEILPSHTHITALKPLCTGRLTDGRENEYPSHYPHVLGNIHSHRIMI